MNIVPNKRVLVKQIQLDQKQTSSGLVLPSALDREAKTQGKVIAVGDDARFQHYKGKILFYGTFAGEKIKVMEDGKEQEYILLTDDEILGWME